MIEGTPGAVAEGRPGVPPPDIAEIAGRLRLILVDLNRRFRTQDSPGEVTPSQLSALSIVAAAGRLRVGELAAHMAISAPTASHVVDALHDQGLIVREHDPADRRVCRITAAPAGLVLLDDLRKRATGILAERIGRLPADQLAALAEALPALEALGGPDPKNPLRED